MTMTAITNQSFDRVTSWVRKELLKTRPLMTGEWQSQDISDKPMLATREIPNFSFDYKIPGHKKDLIDQVEPNLPWAEDHFQERISGEPLNPPPSNEWWPFAQKNNAEHKIGEKFSHTYPERMWPKFANVGNTRPNGRQVFVPHNGIRFEYGDLGDVIDQLARGPLTRQAYLPIWFPEDTGAVHGERVPCTLGYHFMIRGDELQITYYIRSCDFVRHFRDDVYMACRLAQWVAENVADRTGNDELTARMLYMHIVSFHCFEGDVPALELQVKEDEKKLSQRLLGAF